MLVAPLIAVLAGVGLYVYKLNQPAPARGPSEYDQFLDDSLKPGPARTSLEVAYRNLVLDYMDKASKTTWPEWADHSEYFDAFGYPETARMLLACCNIARAYNKLPEVVVPAPGKERDALYTALRTEAKAKGPGLPYPRQGLGIADKQKPH